MTPVDSKPKAGKLGKTLKAYRLAAAALDSDRALIGQVPREWLNLEIERQIRVADIPMRMLNTARGREILAQEFFPDQDINADLLELTHIPERHPHWQNLINTNRLPKLEPSLNGVILSANLLQGVRRYGKGGTGNRQITHNLVVAALLHDCLGRRDRLACLDLGVAPLIDEAFIEREFGPQVLVHVRTISRHLKEFDHAFQVGTVADLKITARYANAIACLAAGKLRLSARAAGDEIISTLSASQKSYLHQTGTPTRGDFPERPFLERDYYRTRAAFSLPGVDYSALREPLEHSLLQAVEDALMEPRKRHRLVGRRGRALHEVHTNIPMMEYYDAPAMPNAISTVHLAALEMSRHLDKGRRKSLSTMAAHAFTLANAAWEAFGESLEGSIACTAILHDVVEDGSKAVSGYDQSLRKLRKRFGGPIAAMVSEVTDAENAQQGPEKARYTLETPGIRSARGEYDVGRFTHMRIRATDARRPYTTAGIVTKLVDTAMTFEESVHDPDSLEGWWRHSGIRIYWAEKVRGPIITPLLDKLIREIKRCNSGRDFNAYGGLSDEMLAGMRRLIHTLVDAADRYMAQNLTILASEYGLEPEEERQLLSIFTDPDISEQQFKARVIDQLLDDQRLDAQIQLGRVPSRSHVVLFPKCIEHDPHLGRDEGTLLGYRQRYQGRCSIRRQLSLPLAGTEQWQKLIDEVVVHYHRSCGSKFEEPASACNF